VVFLVLEDKSMSFPQINYQINGIVGFPVIEAFRQITFTRSDEILIPARPGVTIEAKVEQNLCLDDLNPVLLAAYNNRQMAFTLDTGAQTSTFYPEFFKAEETEIKRIAKSQNVRIGGAGGYREYPAYVAESLTLTVAGKNAELKNLEILIEPTNEDSRYFYGNLGQDLIRQFERMTLDFERMTLDFE
jgi:hypothetical protein